MDKNKKGSEGAEVFREYLEEFGRKIQANEDSNKVIIILFDTDVKGNEESVTFEASKRAKLGRMKIKLTE